MPFFRVFILSRLDNFFVSTTGFFSFSFSLGVCVYYWNTQRSNKLIITSILLLLLLQRQRGSLFRKRSSKCRYTSEKQRLCTFSFSSSPCDLMNRDFHFFGFFFLFFSRPFEKLKSSRFQIWNWN